jgi:hypothetical protein
MIAAVDGHRNYSPIKGIQNGFAPSAAGEQPVDQILPETSDPLLHAPDNACHCCSLRSLKRDWHNLGLKQSIEREACSRIRPRCALAKAFNLA